jgi:hypothetical protein
MRAPPTTPTGTASHMRRGFLPIYSAEAQVWVTAGYPGAVSGVVGASLVEGASIVGIDVKALLIDLHRVDGTGPHRLAWWKGGLLRWGAPPVAALTLGAATLCTSREGWAWGEAGERAGRDGAGRAWSGGGGAIGWGEGAGGVTSDGGSGEIGRAHV